MEVLRGLIIHKFDWGLLLSLSSIIRRMAYSSNACTYYFFSPGAKTPSGGCILQPSSGL